MNDQDLYLDGLSKDDREALLNKKMEEIHRKNEALQRRHAEIEADKKAAEMKGIAVSLKPPPAEETEAVSSSPTKPSSTQPNMRGVRVTLEQDIDAAKTNKFTSGRGKRKEEALKAQEQERLRNAANHNMKRDAMKPPKKPPITAVDTTQHPPEPPKNFLQDNLRQGPLPDSLKNRSARNQHNYGGSDFSNVSKQIQYEKQKHRYEGPPMTKEDLELRMTGKERREYVSWRQEREQIDHERLERHKSNEGIWKREWDTDKKKEPPTPPVSRRVEPGKRPAGRIGSGRFGLTDERNKHATAARDKSPLQGEPVVLRGKRGSNQAQVGEMRVISTGGGETGPENQQQQYEQQQHQRDRNARQQQYTNYNVRGSDDNQSNSSLSPRENWNASALHQSSGYQRNHLSSEGSIEDTRQVQEENDSLVIQVVNDFSGSGLDGRRGRGNRGDYMGRGREFNSNRQSGDFSSNRFSGDYSSNRKSGDFSSYRQLQSGGDYVNNRKSGDYSNVNYRQYGDGDNSSNRKSGDFSNYNAGGSNRMSGDFSSNRQSGDFSTSDYEGAGRGGWNRGRGSYVGGRGENRGGDISRGEYRGRGGGEYRGRGGGGEYRGRGGGGEYAEEYRGRGGEYRGQGGEYRGRGGEYRGRGGGGELRGEYRGRGGEYRGRGGEYRGRGGENTGEYRGRGGGGEYREEYRGRGGEYRGNRGYSRGGGEYQTEYRGRGSSTEYRGRGGGYKGSGYENYEGADESNRGYRGGRSGSFRSRGGRRGGFRGRSRYDQEEEEDDPPILGTVVIDTSQPVGGSVDVDEVASATSDRKLPTNLTNGIQQRLPVHKSKRRSPDAPLSPGSEASGSWATDSQGDWETEEEIEGEEGEDQYEEDDYWEEGLDAQTTMAKEYPVLVEEVTPVKPKPKSETAKNNMPLANAEGEEEDDAHNSSSESLERFIQAHTLHLNITTGNLEAGGNKKKREAVEPITPEPCDSEQQNTSSEVMSPFSPMKTPEGHVHCLDWAADGSSPDISSPKKQDNLDLSMDSNISSEHNDSIEKSRAVKNSTSGLEGDISVSELVLDKEKTKDGESKSSEQKAYDEDDCDTPNEQKSYDEDDCHTPNEQRSYDEDDCDTPRAEDTHNREGEEESSVCLTGDADVDNKKQKVNCAAEQDADVSDNTTAEVQVTDAVKSNIATVGNAEENADKNDPKTKEQEEKINANESQVLNDGASESKVTPIDNDIPEPNIRASTLESLIDDESDTAAATCDITTDSSELDNVRDLNADADNKDSNVEKAVSNNNADDNANCNKENYLEGDGNSTESTT